MVEAINTLTIGLHSLGDLLFVDCVQSEMRRSPISTIRERSSSKLLASDRLEKVSLEILELSEEGGGVFWVECVGVFERELTVIFNPNLNYISNILVCFLLKVN